MKTLNRIKELRKFIIEDIPIWRLRKPFAKEEMLDELIELEIEIRRDEIGQEWNESRTPLGC